MTTPTPISRPLHATLPQSPTPLFLSEVEDELFALYSPAPNKPLPPLPNDLDELIYKAQRYDMLLDTWYRYRFVVDPRNRLRKLEAVFDIK